LVEFALLLPFLALIVIGTVDAGRGFTQQNRLKNAAREGAAYAQLKPVRVNCPSGVAGIRQRVINEDPDLASLPGFNVTVRVNGVNVTNHCAEPVPAPDQIAGGQLVEVIVEGEFDVLTPFVGAVTGDPIVQRATTKTVVQN
jgi:hypothetical protein